MSIDEHIALLRGLPEQMPADFDYNGHHQMLLILAEDVGRLHEELLYYRKVTVDVLTNFDQTLQDAKALGDDLRLRRDEFSSEFPDQKPDVFDYGRFRQIMLDQIAEIVRLRTEVKQQSRSLSWNKEHIRWLTNRLFMFEQGGDPMKETDDTVAGLLKTIDKLDDHLNSAGHFRKDIVLELILYLEDNDFHKAASALSNKENM